MKRPLPNPSETEPSRTLDGRYIVVRGRLWRAANPELPADRRDALVAELMSARRAVHEARGRDAEVATARARVDAAKVALGERGPVWWEDGAPDYNRKMVANTPYVEWFRSASANKERPTEL